MSNIQFMYKFKSLIHKVSFIKNKYWNDTVICFVLFPNPCLQTIHETSLILQRTNILNRLTDKVQKIHLKKLPYKFQIAFMTKHEIN